MKLPRDYILQIRAKSPTQLEAEWIGELVRCKDCIMARQYDSYSRGWWCIIHRNLMQDDYFCADGRRE